MLKARRFLSEQKYIILISIFLFAGIYGLNYYFPITLDDWIYSMNADGSQVRFKDIIPYQYEHYFNWGGRSVVHAIAQFMLASGIFLGDIINSIGYVALALTIYCIANKNNKVNISLFVGINLMIWFLVPSLVENIFWITGSANYLWGTLLIFLFISFYCSAFLNNNLKDSRIKRIVMFLFGIIAGWTNENMAVAMIFFVICLMLLIRKEKQVMCKWMLFGLLGGVVGCAFMLLSPGNYVRNIVELNALSSGGEEPAYMFYFYRFTNILKIATRYFLIPSIIYLVLMLLYLKFKKDNDNRILFLSLLFAVTAGVAILAMVAAPIFPERVWFAILILMFTATGLLYANLDFSVILLKVPLYIITGMVTLVFFYSYWQSLNDFRRIHDIWAERERIILAEKQKGVKDVVVYGRFKASDSWFVKPKTGDIPLDSVLWLQNACGRYYGVNSVKIFDK